MKKLSYVFMIFTLLTFVACGGSSENSEANEEQTEDNASEDMTGMTELDLSPHGMNLSIMIPDESFGQPVITENQMGGVDINIGDKFGVSVLFGMGDILLVKSDLENDLVYENKIVVDEPDLIMYERTIPDSGVEPEYHFYFTRGIDGETYDVQNVTDRSFNKSAVEKMTVSAMSLKGKTPS